MRKAGWETWNECWKRKFIPLTSLLKFSQAGYSVESVQWAIPDVDDYWLILWSTRVHSLESSLPLSANICNIETFNYPIGIQAEERAVLNIEQSTQLPVKMKIGSLYRDPQDICCFSGLFRISADTKKKWMEPQKSFSCLKQCRGLPSAWRRDRYCQGRAGWLEGYSFIGGQRNWAK